MTARGNADLADATNDNAWVQWSLGWEATPGDHNIRVRATDHNGVVQDGTPRSVAPDGATGYHQRGHRSMSARLATHHRRCASEETSDRRMHDRTPRNRQTTRPSARPCRRAVFNRPESRNALSDEIYDGFNTALPVAQRDDIGVLMVTGEGGAFCSGGDVKGSELVTPEKANR